MKRSSLGLVLPGAVLVVLACLSACAGKTVAPYERPPPVQALPAGDEGLELLDSNADGLRWRLALIDSARYSIDAQYYLWYGDAAGRILAKRLLDAADRGVRVRLLVDDLNTLLSDAGTVKLRDRVAAFLDAHPNVELRLFNPWTRRGLGGRLGEAVTDLKRINQRMHNKALIVDNRAAIVGGRNVGDEYMGLNDAFNFHDLDVLGVGPVARQASAVFDAYWNSRWVMPVSVLGISIAPDEQAAARVELVRLVADTSSLAQFSVEPRVWAGELAELGNHLRMGTSVVHADLPTDEGFEQLMLEHIRSLMSSARSELLIVNAYIIPTDWGISMLRTLSDTGVRSRILTNSLASHDVPAVNSHYRKWRKPILEAGAELYELRHDAAIRPDVADTRPVVAKFMGLHAKAMVVDRHRVYIGSMNYDPRSAVTNTEMGVFIDSAGLGAALAALIERDMESRNSWRVGLDDGRLRWANDAEVVERQPARSFWQRVEDVFFRAFPEEYY
ncbi:MAG: phospholipase D family protein [Gammaproteobacteria bacterium]